MFYFEFNPTRPSVPIYALHWFFPRKLIFTGRRSITRNVKVIIKGLEHGLKSVETVIFSGIEKNTARFLLCSYEKFTGQFQNMM